MLDILAVAICCIYFSRKAKAKGQPQGKWIGYTIGAFLCCEFIGAFFVTVVLRRGAPMTFETLKHATGADFLQIFTILIFGLGGLLFVNYKLDQLPAKRNDDNWMDRIGKPE